MKTPARPAGFTIVEMMITLTILAILAALALPTMRDLMRNNARTALANDLLSTFLLARAEAARRGRAMVVCGVDDANGNQVIEPAEQDCTGGTTWDDGWLVAEWADANSDGALDSGELSAPIKVFENANDALHARASGMAGTPDDGVVAVMPFNRAGSSGRFTICDARGPDRARAIDLASSGRPILRSNDVEDPGAGVALTCP